MAIDAGIMPGLEVGVGFSNKYGLSILPEGFVYIDIFFSVLILRAYLSQK
jgi:hypothetical protein